MTEETRRPRRAPAPGERKLDAERSRRLLLDAALEEFAAKGYAGARVQDIADRAGVNKQLINYYFGGKEGLYREIACRWRETEAGFNDPGIGLDEVLVRYLRHALDDPRGTRLNALRNLTGTFDGEPPVEREDLSELVRRQAEGELADDLDPAAVMLVMMAMVSAPVVLPLAVRRVFGVSPDSPEFQEHYAEQIRRIVRHLAADGWSADGAGTPADAAGTPADGDGK
ncbi:TetR/AcrR family transcriptional regulator [Actinomadura verrucosospora]|uniref:TetR family transcriptional regulator n=1 Tax=Actinomadura verrucosospora TaxID=46165 RepID=A0A7D3VXZ2_ACTVE|nr:TetR family transcriptional regulator [Actinomadura verrucosospora]QKG25410.1 TetR family transcriptional regulator [Actinomadura verrucosospora]